MSKELLDLNEREESEDLYEINETSLKNYLKLL